MKAPEVSWAVVVQGARREYVMVHSIRRTRADAIEAYLDAFHPKSRYAEWSAHDDVRAVKVTVQVLA